MLLVSYSMLYLTLISSYNLNNEIPLRSGKNVTILLTLTGIDSHTLNTTASLKRKRREKRAWTSMPYTTGVITAVASVTPFDASLGDKVAQIENNLFANTAIQNDSGHRYYLECAFCRLASDWEAHIAS